MSAQSPSGIISHKDSSRPVDYLFRVSLKCLIINDNNEVLVVKEAGRDWWDLPGGGMNHGENIRAAIVRELKEEVSLTGDFIYSIISCEDPGYLSEHGIWQVRLIFEVEPENMVFSPGEDADQAVFMEPAIFERSKIRAEREIYNYASLAFDR